MESHLQLQDGTCCLLIEVTLGKCRRPAPGRAGVDNRTHFRGAM
jgi:hypothetical protein